jgi:selenophosphate synthetase-related protein
MSSKRYIDEFKIEAVRQIDEYDRSVAKAAGRLGVSIHGGHCHSPASFCTGAMVK